MGSRQTLAAILALTLVVSATASAQTLAGKPIRIVIPVAAGAATDTLGRIAGEWIGKRTGLPVVIENRTGAGGNIALEQVARGEPDGHTLLVATNGAITINRALFKKEPIDTLSDIVPVAPLASFSNILVVNAALPARTAADLIALARTRPGTVNYGSAGPGTTPHLGLALFGRLAGVDLVHVPYRGMTPAVTDLLGGNVQAVAVGYATVAPFVEQGLLRVLAVAAHQRLAYLPDVPTAVEIGLPRWELETWYGLFAPRGTPSAIVAEINRHIAALLDDPATRKRYEDNYYEPMRLSADDFASRIRAESARWESIVRDTGIEVQ